MATQGEESSERAHLTGQQRTVGYVVSLFPCWSETFILREILALRKRGVSVRIFSLKPASEPLVHEQAKSCLSEVLYPPSFVPLLGGLLQQFLRQPVTFFRLLGEAVNAARQQGRGELCKALYTIAVSAYFARIVRRVKIDHLHAHWATYPALAVRVMHILTGKPYSFTAHAHDIFLPNPYLSGNLTAAQTVVTISEYNRRFLISSGTPAKKITVIPCGLDLQEFCVQPDRTPAHGTIVSIGRLDPIKGFLSLIDACALLQERGVPFACEIVGEGPQRRELEQQIHAHGLREKFHLLGALSQAQVREVLARAELFVLPSVRTADGNQDGIPVALMEAMALGIPVISTQVSGIPELVIDEVSGLLIPPQDARALAAALERLLGNASLREKVAAGGSQMVRAHHDIALSAAQMQTVFDEARRAA